MADAPTAPSDRTQTTRPGDFTPSQLQGMTHLSLQDVQAQFRAQAQALAGLPEKQGFPPSDQLLGSTRAYPDGSSTQVHTFGSSSGDKGLSGLMARDSDRPTDGPQCGDDERGEHSYDLTGQPGSYSTSHDVKGDGARLAIGRNGSGTLEVTTHDAQGREHDTSVDYTNGQPGAPHDTTPTPLEVPPMHEDAEGRYPHPAIYGCDESQIQHDLHQHQ